MAWRWICGIMLALAGLAGAVPPPSTAPTLTPAALAAATLRDGARFERLEMLRVAVEETNLPVERKQQITARLDKAEADAAALIAAVAEGKIELLAAQDKLIELQRAVSKDMDGFVGTSPDEELHRRYQFVRRECALLADVPERIADLLSKAGLKDEAKSKAAALMHEASRQIEAAREKARSVPGHRDQAALAALSARSKLHGLVGEELRWKWEELIAGELRLPASRPATRPTSRPTTGPATTQSAH